VKKEPPQQPTHSKRIARPRSQLIWEISVGNKFWNLNFIPLWRYIDNFDKLVRCIYVTRGYRRWYITQAIVVIVAQTKVTTVSHGVVNCAANLVKPQTGRCHWCLCHSQLS